MIMVPTEGDEYHDLAAARQQAASIMVSGTSSSTDANDFVTQKMSFHECEMESIELTVSINDALVGMDETSADSNLEEVVASSTTSICNEAGEESIAPSSTPTPTTTSSTLPLAPDIAKEYYNVITTSAMMGSVPRLFSSDAANNYYHALSTRTLLKDESFKTRGGTNKASWKFGRKKCKEGETVVKQEEEEALIGEMRAEKSDSEIDEGRTGDDTDTPGSGRNDTASSPKLAGTFKKLVTEKLFITKSTDSYERLHDGNDNNKCDDENNHEEVIVETVTSSDCDSSDSTVLSGNSSNSLRYAGLNDVGEVVTDTTDGNVNSNGEEVGTKGVNETKDAIERSRSPASAREIDVNSQDHYDSIVSLGSSKADAASNTTKTLDELLAEAVAASSTPEEVARYILDYEMGSVPSSNQSKDSSQKSADENIVFEMLLAEAVVASVTPDDVARYLLEHDQGKICQTKLVTSDQLKEVVETSDTLAEIIATEFPSSKSKTFRSVRSMSPSIIDHSTQTVSSLSGRKKTATVLPIPSSPNDTSPVFGSSEEAGELGEVLGEDLRDCIDSSVIEKCVSFDKQVIEKDVKQSNKMKALTLPPLPPRPQQTNLSDMKQQKMRPVVATSSDDDGSVECSFVVDDMMTLKSAPSCGGCSIKTEYISTSSNHNVEGKQSSQKVVVSTELKNSSDIDAKVPTVKSGTDVAQDVVIEEQKLKLNSSTNEVNPNATLEKNNVCLSSLISSSKDGAVANNDTKDTVTIATDDKTKETTASTVEEDEYAKLYGPILIETTTPNFCVDPKLMAEEFISDLKRVQSSVKDIFANFFPRKGKDVTTGNLSKKEKEDDSKDDESVISWSQLKRK
jgi:hypothetical protein